MIRVIAIVISLAALGVVIYLIFNKNQKQWYEMSEQEQNKKKMLMTGGLIVFLAGLITAIYSGKKK